MSRTPVTRSALVKARRFSAFARQSGSTCRCAPRPGRRRRGSGLRPGTAASTSATTRSNMEAGARSRQPTQVRTGNARRTTAEVYPVSGARSARAAPRACRGAVFPRSLRSFVAALVSPDDTGPGCSSLGALEFPRAQGSSGAVYSAAAGVGTSLASGPGSASGVSVSGRISIRQPVSRAASRAFCPSRPIANESWKSGTVTRAVRVARSTTSTRSALAGDSALPTNSRGPPTNR